MPELQNCNRCGKTFQYIGIVTVCPDCIEKDNTDYDKIRTYLFAHPQAKVFQVSTELDMPVNRIKRFLREGRLEIVEKNNLFLRCETCGCAIQSGLYCDSCAKQRQHDFKVSYSESRAPRGETKINYLSQDAKNSRRFATR